MIQISQRRVAMALMCIGRISRELGDLRGAITTCEEVVDRFGDSNTPELQIWAAMALTSIGAFTRELGDLPGAIAVLEQVVERFGESEKIDFHLWVAIALTEMGRAKRDLGDPAGGIEMWEEVVERYGDSDKVDLQQWVGVGLVNKGMRQAEMGRAVDALHVCDELERRILALPDSEDSRLNWGMLCVRALALMVQKKGDAALQAFRCAYARFAHSNETSMREMLHIVPYLVAVGAPERDLVAILTSDPAKSRALAPLIVALRERQGETVRAPAEVREVAADVREKIDDRVRSWADATAVSSP